MDIYLLVVVIVLALLMIGASIFILRYYVDKEEKGFGSQIIIKIIAV